MLMTMELNVFTCSSTCRERFDELTHSGGGARCERIRAGFRSERRPTRRPLSRLRFSNVRRPRRISSSRQTVEVSRTRRKTYSVLSHRGAAMVDKMWLNLAAERGIALATWGLYPSDRRLGEARRGQRGC